MIIFYPYVYKINKGDFFLLFNNTLLQIYIQRKKITKIAKETAKIIKLQDYQYKNYHYASLYIRKTKNKDRQ